MTGTVRGNPQAGKKPEHKRSQVLSGGENDKLFALIPPRCQAMAAAVVQVYLADPPSLNRWNKRCCGVAALIKDNPVRSYFIRVYDIRAGKLIWEQELYVEFKYRTPRPHFHTFDTDNCPAGLNFTNVEEGQAFRDAVNDAVNRRAARKAEKKPPTASAPGAPNSLAPSMPKPNSSLSKSMTNLPAETKNGKKKKDDKKKKKLTKDDIGIPTGFTHLSHIGWDPDKGYDTNNLDPSLKTFFDHAGISTAQLEDKETAKFIYDFIDKRGGLDTVKQEVQQAKTRPPPPRVPPSSSRGKPPPPPARGPSVPAPPPPSRGPATRPPPGPPSRGGPPAPPPPPPMGGGPPAPPPPPIGGPVPPPPPPISAPAPQQAPKPAMPSLSGALQDEIHRGLKLRSVETNEMKSAPADGRSALMNEIVNQNHKLKPAPASSAGPVAAEPEGLAGALAMALAHRAKVTRDSDQEESEDDDDDEFDDDDWAED